MKIIIQTNKLKCDMGICKNSANYSVVPDGADQSQYVNLCKDCMKKLYVLSSEIYKGKASKDKTDKDGARGKL